MSKLLKTLGDRMLERVVPSTKASAVNCDRIWVMGRGCCWVCFYPTYTSISKCYETQICG